MSNPCRPSLLIIRRCKCRSEITFSSNEETEEGEVGPSPVFAKTLPSGCMSAILPVIAAETLPSLPPFPASVALDAMVSTRSSNASRNDKAPSLSFLLDTLASRTISRSSIKPLIISSFRRPDTSSPVTLSASKPASESSSLEITADTGNAGAVTAVAGAEDEAPFA